jgi:hypothetical protein
MSTASRHHQLILKKSHKEMEKDSSHWEWITQNKSARPAKEESITSII